MQTMNKSEEGVFLGVGKGRLVWELQRKKRERCSQLFQLVCWKIPNLSIDSYEEREKKSCILVPKMALLLLSLTLAASKG